MKYTRKPVLTFLLFAAVAGSRLIADETATIDQLFERAWGKPNRDFLLCAEMLDHRGDHGVYLRRPIKIISSSAIPTSRTDLIQTFDQNHLKFAQYKNVLLLKDDELGGINDNPLDLEVPSFDVSLPPGQFVAYLAEASGVNILTSARAGRFSNTPVAIVSKTPISLRQALVLFAGVCSVEWIAEITPASQTVKQAAPGAYLLPAPKGFVTLQIAN